MKPDKKAREALVLAATTAYRARSADGALLDDPSWRDLDESGRREAFAETQRQRALEAAADPRGLSATGRAVLARILSKS